jgi:hypothetical protein
MFLTLKNASKTNSPVPPWALERIKIAFNVEELQETAGAGGGFRHAEPHGNRLRVFERLSLFIRPTCISCIFQRFLYWR